MGKKKYIFFFFTIFILLFFLFEFISTEIMNKKEGYLIKNEKHSIELIKNRNAKYANRIHIKSLKDSEVSYTKDIADLNAWKLEVGDIDGDGIDEIALGVYTESPLHPIDAKRPYIYSFNGEALIPKWRGSRLSRPFVDFVLYDIDEDGTDEIIAIEILKSRKYKINSYKWKGFGFEGYLESKELIYTPNFHVDNKFLYIKIRGKEEYYKIEINEERSKLEWRKEDES